MLVFTDLLLRALAVAVIFLRCCVALPFLMFFSPLTALAIAKPTAVSTTVIATGSLLLLLLLYA